MAKQTQVALSLLLLALLATVASAKFEKPKRHFDDEVLLRHQSHGPVGADALKFLNIHLIPHSHDDVGWLKTVDEYYYGADNANQWAGVQYTIDTVIDELRKNSTRKFVQVETAFLYRWWIDSPEDRRELYRDLVAKGQIEFINGGWCMHDEASPYYEDIVDQMTVGHQWLLETFGSIPTIGWHIDPFGHQATNAALFNQMGFNGWWFSRIDYQDKDVRMNTSSLEMIWSPYQASGEDNSIFSAVNYNHYNPPEHFNFDLLSRDEPIMDNPHLEGYNIDWKCDEFVSYFRNMSMHFRSDHLMHTMGEDFNYANALMWYKNMDKLINYINARSDAYQVRVFYSTPSIYLEEIHKQNIVFPTKTDDFFPYADAVSAYWTGYFTSRVALKGHVRHVGRYLQHVRNIFSAVKLNASSRFFNQNYQLFLDNLNNIEQNMAILQHHDAVAGTEKQYVAYDYVYRLQNSTDKINEVLHPVLEEAAYAQIRENVKYSQCLWNTTAAECPIVNMNVIGGSPVLISIQNPTIARNITIRIRVPELNYRLIDITNQAVYGELFCVDWRNQNDCDLYFDTELAAHSLTHFKLLPYPEGVPNIIKITGTDIPSTSDLQNLAVSKQVSLSLKTNSNVFTLTSCNNNNNLSRVKSSSHLKGRQQQQEEEQLCDSNDFEVIYDYYRAYEGKGQKSGAYIFRPANDCISNAVPYSEITAKKSFQGQLLTIVTLEGAHTHSQMRVSPRVNNVVELETFIDSIPLDLYIGKEVVLRVNTSLANNQTFYTDSNGLELQKRILNYRPTWDLNVSQPSSGNYYPVNGLITLTDGVKRVSIVNDRSQGGTSLNEGQLELMIHRRLLFDDGRGVGEPLNETETYDKHVGLRQIVRHYIVFESAESTNLARGVQNHLDNTPIIMFAKSTTNKFTASSATNAPLKSVSLLTESTNPFLKVYLRPFGDDYLLRLNNLNDSQTATLDIPDDFLIVEELTLTANQSVDTWKAKRYQWQTEDPATTNPNNFNRHLTESAAGAKTLEVKPLQLRAFRLRQVAPINTVDSK